MVEKLEKRKKKKDQKSCYVSIAKDIYILKWYGFITRFRHIFFF